MRELAEANFATRNYTAGAPAGTSPGKSPNSRIASASAGRPASSGRTSPIVDKSR